MEEEKKSTFKGPTFCPLKRPQDVIFIFLHCTNTFFRLIPSLTHPLISSQNSIYIHISIAINSSTIAHSYQTKTCLLKFKMVLPPHHNNHWVAMSHKSGETGTPLDSTWGIRVPQFHSLSATSTMCWISFGTSINLGKPRSTCTVASSLASPPLLHPVPALSGKHGVASMPS